jgi:hypothetical protein
MTMRREDGSIEAGGGGFDLAEGVALLERTPRALAALLRGLSAGWTGATEGPGSWSPAAVVAHLIHAERADWIPRARIILEHGAGRAFTPFDREGGAAMLATRSVDELLADFARLRAESLATLAAWRVDDAALARVGRHPELGEVTFGQLLATWVTHDLSHLAQVARVMAKRQRDAVGPWRAYLSILDR